MIFRDMTRVWKISGAKERENCIRESGKQCGNTFSN